MTNYLPKKPLVSQKQVDQAIVNFLLSRHKDQQFRIYLRGGTSIFIRFTGCYFRVLLQYRNNEHLLGYYYSEEVETAPGIDYSFPPDNLITYDEMLLKADALKKTLKQARKEAIQKTREQTLKEQLQNKQLTQTESQVATEVSHPKPDNADKRKQLESRLRIIDLQIEREEILNSLAALK